MNKYLYIFEKYNNGFIIYQCNVDLIKQDMSARDDEVFDIFDAKVLVSVHGNIKKGTLHDFEWIESEALITNREVIKGIFK